MKYIGLAISIVLCLSWITTWFPTPLQIVLGLAAAIYIAVFIFKAMERRSQKGRKRCHRNM